MEASSNFVSKARTAIHSAAAKAERVLTDFKSDFIPDRSDPDKLFPKESPTQVDDEPSKIDVDSKSNNEGRHLKWRPGHIRSKQDWHDRFKNIRIGKRGLESNTEKIDTMAAPFYDENLILLNMKNDAEAKSSQLSSILERLRSTDADTIPPTSVMKQLAVAIESGKKGKSLKDLLTSSGGSSPVRERASLSLAAVKSLVLRDKDEKLTPEIGDDEKLLLLICLLFDAEGNFLRRNISSSSEALYLHKDIHGAPPDCLLVKISEVIGSFKTLQKMAMMWCRVVTELRRLCSEELHIPGIPLDEIPNLNSCLLYQKLQVINCCISRKRRHAIAIESLELVMSNASSHVEESAASKGEDASSNILYAKVNTGELVLRLGVHGPVDNLTMLETGEPVYKPITQEGPLLTEDLIRENEEFVLRTGSVGAGCSQLLSDMQAFKAANPGCILEDFVRWHSPPDWTECETSDEMKEDYDGGDCTSTRGQLSSRMQKEGNLWRELWETSKPIPAVKQAPLFDEDLAIEGILNDLEDIAASELFEQLFISLLGLGFIVAEDKLSCNNDLSKLFYECKDYVVTTCQGSFWSDKVDDLCQVYETVETMLLNPEEVLKMLKQDENSTNTSELKRRFKGLGLNFGSKDRNLKKPSTKDEKTLDENSTRQQFSNFFDKKSSLFSKRPPKPETASPVERIPCPDENDWTIV